MPATLPWPKIANTPSNRRCFFPSISTCWALRKRTIACAAVNRIVAMALPRFNRCSSRGGVSFPALRVIATLTPEIAQSCKCSGHARDRLAIVYAARKPRDSGLGEDRASHRKAFHDAAIVRQREGLRQILFGRFETEQQYPATQGIACLNRSRDVVPRGLVGLAFQLPPVGLDANLVKPLDHKGERAVADRPVLARDDLDQQFALEPARGVIEAQELALLARLHLRRIVRVIEAEALDRMRDRPLHEFGAERAAGLELERVRAWLLDRPANPEAVIDGAEQRLAPVLAVEQHAIPGAARRDFGRGFDSQQLEGADPLARAPCGVGDFL